MKFLYLLTIASLFLFPAASHAQSADDKYYAMVDQAVAKKSKDTDWLALRKAYQDTSFYMGETGDISIKTNMGGLIREATTTEGKKIYLDYARKHFALFSSHFYDGAMAKKGSDSFADTDTNIQAVKGILSSIEADGDGKTCATSHFVIDTGEEYILFRSKGLQPAGQSLVNADGKICDRMDFVNASTKEKGNIYFDVTKLMNTPVR